jgi:uncharacterized phage protein gp47/JayE
MALPTLTYNQFLANITSALASQKITNLRAGSTAFAFAQAMSAMGISLQQLMVHVANITRLATSYGADVDSYVGDFGMKRLPAITTQGQVFATRTISGSTLIVPVTGAVCQTSINQIQFQLIGDSSQPNYNTSDNSYIYGPNDTSISMTAQAITNPLTLGIAANTLTQIVSGFVGVNSITNPLPFTNGMPAESDIQLKIRFVEFIGSLAQATETAIEYAINTVQQGLTFKLIETLTFGGAPYPGGFTVVVDDGTGNISSALLAAITTAILPVRAAGIVFQVFAPTNVPINVNCAVAALPGYSQSALEAQVESNIAAFINTLGVGVNCGIVNVGAIIQNTPGVMEYSGLTLNGGTTDIDIALTQLARAGSITVT